MSLVFFAIAVVLMPVRLRAILQARPVPPVYRDYTDYLLCAADAAVVCMLACWVASLALAPRHLSLGPRSMWMPLAALALLAGASAFASLDPPLSVYHAIRLGVLLWFYVFIVNEVHGWMWLWVPVGIQLLLQSLVALAQFWTQRSLGLQWAGEPRLDPALNGVSVVAAGGMRLLRAYGLTDHPNILGGCLAFGTLLLLPAVLHAPRHSLALAALFPAGGALVVTFSRSAWLAFAVGALTMIVMDILGRRTVALRQWMLLGAVWLLLTVPVVLLYPRFFGARLNAGSSFTTPSMEQQSIGERRLLIDAAFSMIAAHPLLGTGLGTAPQALHLYRPDWPVTFEPPHAALVDAALETGLPAAGAYLMASITPLIVFFRMRRQLLTDPLAGAAMAVLLAILVSGLFDYYIWMLPPGRSWQWFGWGIWSLVLGGRLKDQRVTRRHADAATVQALQ